MIRALAGLAMIGAAFKLGARLTPHSTEEEVAGEFIDRLTDSAASDPVGRFLTQDEIDRIRQASRHPKFNINTAWDIFFEECLDSYVGSFDLPDQEEMDVVSSECEDTWQRMLDHFDESIRNLKP